MEISIKEGEYVQFEVNERIFLCSLKTIQKYPESTLAKCVKHSSSGGVKGTTILVECNPKYFQMAIDYMRDGKLNYLESLTMFETTQLSKEAQYLCLDELVAICINRVDAIKDHRKFPGVKILHDRQELQKILDRTKKTGEFTIVFNVDLLTEDVIREVIELARSDGIEFVSCFGKMTGYASEFYEAGKLIQCSEESEDLLSFVYFTYTGVML